MAGKNLVEGEGQMALFPDPEVEKQQAMDQVVDRINQKLGKSTIRRGAGLP
jgi:hypothetical protein